MGFSKNGKHVYEAITSEGRPTFEEEDQKRSIKMFQELTTKEQNKKPEKATIQELSEIMKCLELRRCAKKNSSI